MIFIEPCSGGAAVALRLLGQRPLTPYLGGKAEYADAIISALGIGDEPLEGLILNDAGPWGTAWETLGRFLEWREVAEKVERLGNQAKGKALFDLVAGAIPPPAYVGMEQPACGFTAAFLVLQSAAARGRPVCPELERWSTPGYAHLSGSARAKGFTERLRPDLLAKRIRAIGQAFERLQRSGYVLGGCVDMAACGELLRGSRAASRAVVYIDPPYQSTTGYQHTVDPESLRRVAERWRQDGALVAVSEGVPLPWEGWHHIRLNRPGGRRRMGRVSEWLTMSRPPRGQLQLAEVAA
jgi:hypothetical protein